jgi:hypothetical protein
MDEAEGRRRILQLQSLGGNYDTVAGNFGADKKLREHLGLTSCL